MKTPEWTWASDSCGYMLFKDGVAQGGARTLGTPTHTSDGRRKSQTNIKADRKMHADTARRLCEEKNR